MTNQMAQIIRTHQSNPQTQQQTPVIGYSRVSTHKQVLDGEGLPVQRDRIQAFCTENNYTIIKSFADEGISGAKEVTEREGIMELIEFCRKTPVKYVIIDKVDRLSRELFAQLWVEKQLLVHGTQVIFSAQNNLNGEEDESPMEKATRELMRQMMGAFAQFERTLIVQRCTDGMKKKASKGSRPVGKQPFGYAWDSKDTVVVEPEARVIRTIFNMRAQGTPLNKIVTHLDDTITQEEREEFQIRNQNRKFTVQNLHDMLANDYYTGVVTYSGKKTDGNHQPIISRELYDMANNSRKFTEAQRNARLNRQAESSLNRLENPKLDLANFA